MFPSPLKGEGDGLRFQNMVKERSYDMQRHENAQCKKRKVVGVPTEIYSRIVGYYRPVQNWNDGKKREFADRRPLKYNF